MEPPRSLQATSIRDEKVKVLECIQPVSTKDMDKLVIRGQYGPGYIDGVPVKAYREEDNVNPQSNVETYVALKFSIENWRWAGVPFYLRGGKRLPKRSTKIVITFKKSAGLFIFRIIRL